MKKETTYEQALSRMARLCSTAEHSAFDIRNRLKKAGLSTDDAEKVILRLEKEKYIDNSRFASAFCHDKLHYCNWGRVKIAQSLRLLQIDSNDIRTALDSIDDEEYTEILTKIMTQKNRTIKDTDPYARKTKLARFAASRGFETALVLDIADKMTGTDT